MMDQSAGFDREYSSPNREFRAIPVLLFLLLGAMAAREFAEGRSPRGGLQGSASKATLATTYVNKEYGFLFDLPEDWRGFSVIQEQWGGTSPEDVVQDQTGPLLHIRNPKYTNEEPYEDIPIMVFTHKQWKSVQKGVLAVSAVSAAPFPPGEISHNAKYVFAMPPRFYYDYATGYEKVLRILGNRPIHTFRPRERSSRTS